MAYVEEYAVDSCVANSVLEMEFSDQAADQKDILRTLLNGSLDSEEIEPLIVRLIEEIGSLPIILSQHSYRLLQIRGMTIPSVRVLLAAGKLAKICSEKRILDMQILENWQATVTYCKALLSFKNRHCIAALYLGNQGQLLKTELVQRGCASEVSFFPREIVSRCFQYGATKLMLAKSVGTSELKPNELEIREIESFSTVLKPLDIELIDFMYFNAQGEYSLASGNNMFRGFNV